MEQRAQRASRAPFFVTLSVSIACFAFICIWLSAHRMMWGDEFNAWHLIADRSWRHAFQSWSAGADGGPPLYYAIGRIIIAVTGPHPLALRLYSAACAWLAAFLWTQMLRRHFGGVIAVAATALAFLCTLEFVDQMAQVRFYGQLVLAFSLAVWVALRLQERKPRAWRWFAWSAAAGVFLVTSHPLGIIYSATIALMTVFGGGDWKKRVAAIGGTVVSWSALLSILPGLRSGAETTNWLGVPHLSDVVHFYDNHPMLLTQMRYVSVSLNLALVCVIGYGCVWFLRSWRSEEISDGLRLLFCISVGLMLTPIEFLAISHLYKPLFLSRYLLPYNLGFCTLVAAGVWLLTRRFGIRLTRPFAVLAGVPVALVALLTFREQAVDPRESLEPLLRLAQSTPVVLEFGNQVMQAHYYEPSRSANLFLLLPPLQPGQRTTLHSTMEQGYEPEIVLDQPFVEQHREILYVDTRPGAKIFERLRRDPNWRSEDAGTVAVAGVQLPVVRYTRIDK